MIFSYSRVFDRSVTWANVCSECSCNLLCPSIFPINRQLGAGSVCITLSVTLAQYSLEISVEALYTNHPGIGCHPRTIGFNTRRKYITDPSYSVREATPKYLHRHLRGTYLHPVLGRIYKLKCFPIGSWNLPQHCQETDQRMACYSIPKEEPRVADFADRTTRRQNSCWGFLCYEGFCLGPHKGGLQSWQTRQVRIMSTYVA